METYSFELEQELGKLSGIDLTTRFLAGRADGRPPHALAIAWFFLTSAWHIASHRRHYDIIHFGDMVQIGLAWFSRLCGANTCNVIALHGLDVIYGRRPGIGPRLYKAYTTFCRNRSVVDCFIANSRFTAQLLEEEGFGPISVVPLGVRITCDAPGAPIEQIGDERFVLFFGRIFRRKGPRWFAEHVLPLLPEDVMFYVVGTVWDSQDGEYLHQNPRVRMLGAFPVDFGRDQFESLKRRAIAVVMPNVINRDGKDVEGFGLTALEAADNGAPLIAADVEGIRDAVLHGQTGFLVAAEDNNAWAKLIVELLDWSVEQRQEFSRNAIAGLEQHFSWARVAQDTANVYLRSMENR